MISGPQGLDYAWNSKNRVGKSWFDSEFEVKCHRASTVQAAEAKLVYQMPEYDEGTYQYYIVFDRNPHPTLVRDVCAVEFLIGPRPSVGSTKYEDHYDPYGQAPYDGYPESYFEYP